MRVSNEPLRSCPVPKLFVASIMALISRPKVSATRCKFSLSGYITAHFLLIIDPKFKEGNTCRRDSDSSEFFLPQTGQEVCSFVEKKEKRK